MKDSVHEIIDYFQRERGKHLIFPMNEIKDIFKQKCFSGLEGDRKHPGYFDYVGQTPLWESGMSSSELKFKHRKLGLLFKNDS